MEVRLVPPAWLKETEAKREHGDISALAESIREVGLLNPLTVNEDGKLLAGRRRFAALSLLGWESIPVRVLRSDGPVFDFKVALEENLRRLNLSDVEVAEALKEYQELREAEEGKKGPGYAATLKQFAGSDLPQCSESENGRTQQKTAEEFGISRQAVTKALSIARAVEEYPDLRPLQKGSVVLQEAAKRRDAALRMSESNEWYTPSEYVEAARSVLGCINVDPASSDKANETVKAATYFTKEDDGLSHDWPGRVWLNPPYGGLSAPFTERLIRQYQAGITTAAVLLVNANSTDTGWFQALWDYVLCFTIDGLVERRGRFLMLEAKSPGVPIKTGQAMTFEALRKTGRFTVIVIWGERNKPEEAMILGPTQKTARFPCNLGCLRQIVREWYEGVSKTEGVLRE